MFPKGFASLRGFMIIALVLIISQPIIGALSVQAENVTQEQMLALQQQQQVALEKQEAARKQEEEAARLQALEARKAVFRESGTRFNLNDIPESTLLLAEQIKQSTPLDYRSSLAAAVYSRKFNLRPSLLLAVISKESNFHQNSVGSSRDRGYMQIIPSTERFMMKSYGSVLGLKYNPEQIFEPEYNLGLGTAYLSGMMAEYKDVNHILTEYNRGEGGARSFYRRNGSYSTSYSKAILNEERLYANIR